MAIPVFGSSPLAFTVTLLPHFTRTRTSVQQLEQSERIVRSFIRRSCPSAKISMVAELTKNSDIHYHALLTGYDNPVIDTLSYYYNNLKRNKEYSKVIGFICIKACPTPEHWVKYMLKDVNKTSSLLGQTSICVDEVKCLDFQLQIDSFNF